VSLAKIDEEVVVDDRTFYLGTNEYHDGTIDPNGYLHLQEFRMDRGIARMTYSVS